MRGSADYFSFVTMKQTQNVHKWTNRPVKVQISMAFGYIC